jgi:hypothetical protein
MAQATPLLPLWPLTVTHLPALPRFLTRPQRLTRTSPLPVGEGSRLVNLAALQPVLSTTCVAALVSRGPAAVRSSGAPGANHLRRGWPPGGARDMLRCDPLGEEASRREWPMVTRLVAVSQRRPAYNQ